MKRFILLTACLLSTYLALAQVAEPQINPGSGSKPKPVTAPKKAEVRIIWRGSVAQNFEFRVDDKEYWKYTFEPNQGEAHSFPAGYIQIKCNYFGTTYYSEYIKLDAGDGELVITLDQSNKRIRHTYESEEDIRERERQAELARQAELRKKEAENTAKGNKYIDDAYTLLRSGNCDKAQSNYNSALTYFSSGNSRMEQLYNSIRACRSHNAYEIAMDEAKGHKRNGYLSAALTAYQKALSHKSGDYEATKAVNTIESEMNRARSFESEGDRYFNAGNYSQAYSSYNSAVSLWSAKTGLTDKRDNAYYRMNKALGKAALDRGDYADALKYFAKAKEDSRGKNDSDIKQWEKDANYELNREKGEQAMRSGEFFTAYEYFRAAKSYKNTNEIQEFEKDALKKTFEFEWGELVRKDNIDSYEKFLKRWSNIDSEKESFIYKRLYELEFEEGRRRFQSVRTGYSNFSSALKWLDKYDPDKKMGAERRRIRRFMNYDPEEFGFQLNYALPIMLGYSQTDTRENLNDVSAPLPYAKPAQTNIKRSGFYFLNRFNGGAQYRSDIIIPLGKSYIALPYSFGGNYQNVLVENISMTGLYDATSDGYAQLPNYDAYRDTIAAYKGDNSWSSKNFALSGSLGYRFVNLNLTANLQFQYNFGAMRYNGYETCTECNEPMEFKQNFLSSGISLNWNDRLVFSYMNLNGLVRGELDNPENTAKQYSLELKFGPKDAYTRFSLVGQWYAIKTYPLLTTGAEPANSLTQFRLFPTFNFRF